MIPTQIAKFFNLPERTIRKWAREYDEDNWRTKIVKLLNNYKILEEKAEQKILKTFNEAEKENLKQILKNLKPNEIEELKKEIENAILLNSKLTKEEKETLLYKIEKLCDFELYVLLKIFQ
jgi:hydrogenase maturation factor HypE